MKQHTKEVTGYILLAMFAALSVVVSISILDSSVVGVNQSNVTTIVNVTNTEPFFVEINLTPRPDIFLNPGGTVNVSCLANVFDFNGFQDFYNATAMIFSDAVGKDVADDNNNHYTVFNDTCQHSQINSTNYLVNCTANVEYYADNGTWSCWMEVYDDGGAKNPDIKINSSAFSNNSANVSTLLALDVPSQLDFGNLTVTQTSADQEFNITNFGNIDINITVRGYANNTDGRNLSMDCVFNDILIENERFYPDAGQPFDSMIIPINDSVNIPNFTLPQREDDTTFGFDRNSTYWKLQIPLSVGGLCTGTLQFTALSAE